MSLKALTWAFKLPTACPGCKLVLLKLADHADEHGRNCFPSVSLIVEATEFAERTVRLHLRHLEKQGHIEITRRYVDRRQTSNAYTLKIPFKRTVPTPPAHYAGAAPAQSAGGDCGSRSLPVQQMQANNEEPSSEPSLNRLVGVAPALEAGARRLREELGDASYEAWFGDAAFDEGPPVTIRAGRPFKATRMNQQLRPHVERAFGSDVEVLPPE